MSAETPYVPGNLPWIADGDDMLKHIYTKTGRMINAYHPDNATFIVTACNAYEADQAKIKALVGALENVKAYHEWVMKERVWHLEANAQVGCLRMLAKVNEALSLAATPSL